MISPQYVDGLELRIKELTAERDELRKLAYIGEHMHEDCSWKARFAELKAERDALAAHVGRWEEWLGSDPEDDTSDWIDEGWSIAKDAPQTSLARLKAQWQAKAIRLAHEKLSERKEWTAAHHLLQVAIEINDTLRHQAGGDA